MLAAFPDRKVIVLGRVPIRVQLGALEDADLAGRAVDDPGMLHALDRDAARAGEVVGRAVVALVGTVLFEPGRGKAGVGVELAMQVVQELVELGIDQLQRGLDGHGAVVGFEHSLVAGKDAHARADG